MINKLRFRFIRITMAAVLIVLTIIIAAINLVNIRRNNQSLDDITQRLAQSNVFLLPKPPEDAGEPHFDFSGFDRGRPFPFHNEKELPFSARFFLIRINESGEIIGSDLRQIASVGEEDLDSIKDGVLKDNRNVGWYHTYRYRVSEADGGFLLIVLEATSTLSTMTYVLFITLAVGVVSFVLIFAIIAVFSKRAIRPIAEAYDKQRQFITDASHELKTPLTVISANTEILTLTHGENEWCDGIARQTNTMRNLIGQMIQMAKLDENNAVQVREEFDLSEAIYDTAVSFGALAAQRELHLNIEIAPALRMIGDEAAIRQVAAILVDNAVKYCDAGGDIDVKLRSAGKRGGSVLTVENSFAAADALDTKRLFDRFYRSDKARESANSFGLGLPIAKSIMEQHKGTLECRKCAEEKIRFCATFRK